MDGIRNLPLEVDTNNKNRRSNWCLALLSLGVEKHDELSDVIAKTLELLFCIEVRVFALNNPVKQNLVSIKRHLNKIHVRLAKPNSCLEGLIQSLCTLLLGEEN